QDFRPPGTRPLVFVDGHWSMALAGPVLHTLVVVGEPYRHPVDAFDVEDALGRLAPRPGHIAHDHHAQACATTRLVQRYVAEGHPGLVSFAFASLPTGTPTSSRNHFHFGIWW